MITGPTDLNRHRPWQFYIVPDDGIMDLKTVGACADEGLVVRVAGVVLDDRRSKARWRFTESKEHGDRGEARGWASKPINSSSRSDNVIIFVGPWHWAKRSTI